MIELPLWSFHATCILPRGIANSSICLSVYTTYSLVLGNCDSFLIVAEAPCQVQTASGL